MFALDNLNLPEYNTEVAPRCPADPTAAKQWWAYVQAIADLNLKRNHAYAAANPHLFPTFTPTDQDLFLEELDRLTFE